MVRHRVVFHVLVAVLAGAALVGSYPVKYEQNKYYGVRLSPKSWALLEDKNAAVPLDDDVIRFLVRYTNKGRHDMKKHVVAKDEESGAAKTGECGCDKKLPLRILDPETDVALASKDESAFDCDKYWKKVVHCDPEKTSFMQKNLFDERIIVIPLYHPDTSLVDDREWFLVVLLNLRAMLKDGGKATLMILDPNGSSRQPIPIETFNDYNLAANLKRVLALEHAEWVRKQASADCPPPPLVGDVEVVLVRGVPKLGDYKTKNNNSSGDFILAFVESLVERVDKQGADFEFSQEAGSSIRTLFRSSGSNMNGPPKPAIDFTHGVMGGYWDDKHVVNVRLHIKTIVDRINKRNGALKYDLFDEQIYQGDVLSVGRKLSAAMVNLFVNYARTKHCDARYPRQVTTQKSYRLNCYIFDVGFFDQFNMKTFVNLDNKTMDVKWIEERDERAEKFALNAERDLLQHGDGNHLSFLLADFVFLPAQTHVGDSHWTLVVIVNPLGAIPNRFRPESLRSGEDTDAGSAAYCLFLNSYPLLDDAAKDLKRHALLAAEYYRYMTRYHSDELKIIEETAKLTPKDIRLISVNVFDTPEQTKGYTCTYYTLTYMEIFIAEAERAGKTAMMSRFEGLVASVGVNNENSASRVLQRQQIMGDSDDSKEIPRRYGVVSQTGWHQYLPSAPKNVVDTLAKMKSAQIVCLIEHAFNGGQKRLDTDVLSYEIYPRCKIPHNSPPCDQRRNTRNYHLLDDSPNYVRELSDEDRWLLIDA